MASFRAARTAYQSSLPDIFPWMHEAVGALFEGTPDAIEVLKWKEMFDTLERATDSCMGVAQVLQSISLKNA